MKKRANHFNWRWLGGILLAMLIYALVGEASPIFARKRRNQRNSTPPKQAVEVPPVPVQDAAHGSVEDGGAKHTEAAQPSSPSVQAGGKANGGVSSQKQGVEPAGAGKGTIQPPKAGNQGDASLTPPTKTEPRKPAAEVTNGWTTKPPPDFIPKARWHRGNLERHWEKHGAEFPEFKSAQEYGDAALYFFEHPPVGTLTKTNAEGDRLFYHQASNTFGVTTADGVPKTMFRPNAGINYWRRQ